MRSPVAVVAVALFVLVVGLYLGGPSSEPIDASALKVPDSAGAGVEAGAGPASTADVDSHRQRGGFAVGTPAGLVAPEPSYLEVVLRPTPRDTGLPGGQ